MLGIGFGEMIIIAGVALVVLGPEKFPDFAKIVLRTVRDLRGYMDDVKSEISKEIRPIQNEIKSLSRYDPETYIDAMSSSSTTKNDTPSGAGSDNAETSAMSTPMTMEGAGADPDALNLQAEGALPPDESGETPSVTEDISCDGGDMPSASPERLDG